MRHDFGYEGMPGAFACPVDAQETDPPAKASLTKRRLTWLVHVTAIITSCVPPKVVGELTSSVTATGVPEVYGLPKTGRNHVRFPAQELPAYQEDWFEGDADPQAHGPVGGRRGTVAVGFAREYSCTERHKCWTEGYGTGERSRRQPSYRLHSVLIRKRLFTRWQSSMTDGGLLEHRRSHDARVAVQSQLFQLPPGPLKKP